MMPGGLIKKLKEMILAPTATTTGVSNLQAKIDVINPKTCKHTMKNYGNPQGKFKACTRCELRWKMHKHRDGTLYWKEHGFMGDDKHAEKDHEKHPRYNVYNDKKENKNYDDKARASSASSSRPQP